MSIARKLLHLVLALFHGLNVELLHYRRAGQVVFLKVNYDK